ncbi:hypothetical protein CIPAW_14G071700 [Carya illinoinensis]|uniref:Uncharacterized protein n=1 Tax=Carya illinoinensis TaxID=32201 RepID=A0A8T1NK32_CARIL|nr:hypothetical protein CIPAW_14G071700 [Carya illinoinensis]
MKSGDVRKQRSRKIAKKEFKRLAKKHTSRRSSDAGLERASKLGDRLGPLRNGVLGEFTRQHETHRGLDLPRGDGGLLVIPREPGSLLGELLKDVIDEAVHDPHGLAGDPDIGVNLFKHLEDVDLVGLNTLLGPLLLLVRGAGSAFLRELLSSLGLLLGWSLLRNRRFLLLGGLLLGGFLLGFGCHNESTGNETINVEEKKAGEALTD